jgi:hypothetical protein
MGIYCLLSADLLVPDPDGTYLITALLSKDPKRRNPGTGFLFWRQIGFREQGHQIRYDAYGLLAPF